MKNIVKKVAADRTNIKKKNKIINLKLNNMIINE